jgi:outer membrane protein insertion porin family
MILNYQNDLSIPSRKLRGFEGGKVGPKDGADFIGGNYVSSALNKYFYTSNCFQTLKILILFFFDAANVWGVDYDSSIDR